MVTANFGWPDWLSQLDPQMVSILALIDRHRDVLSSESMDGLVHKRIAQAQITQFEELGQKHGAVKQYPDGKRLDFETLKKIPFPPGMLRAQVFNISQRHHTLRAYRFAKKIVLMDLVEGVHTSMHAGGFFTGFVAMRAFLMNLAEMNLLNIELADVKPGSDARRAGKLYDDVLSREFGSDMDWLRVPKNDLRQTEDPRILRASPESKRNYELVVQKGIAALGKRAKGIPSAYDILSEFERPRVGTLWLVYEESKSMQDGHKSIWNRNKLGPGFPSVMIEQMKPTITQLFGVLSDALGLMQQIEKELVDIDAKIARHTQDETRNWLWHFPDLFDKHEDCPCGSGKRVKYCCGH
jgi:hypothetical protein